MQPRALLLLYLGVAVVFLDVCEGERPKGHGTLEPQKRQTLPLTPSLRPPSTPLMVQDPYTSVWLLGDDITQIYAQHWTGAPMQTSSLVRVDQQTYRLMGPEPTHVAGLKQTGPPIVMATQTTFSLEGPGVLFRLSFATPALVEDMALLALPVSYVSLEASSLDGKPHTVEWYFHVTGQLCSRSDEQMVQWARGDGFIHMGTVDQAVLKTAGDMVKIDWGYQYLALPSEASTTGLLCAASQNDTWNAFMKSGSLPSHDDTRQPRAVNDDWPVLAVTLNFGPVTDRMTQHFVYSYDDIASLDFFGTKLEALWRTEATMEEVLVHVDKRYDEIRARCDAFDEALYTRLTRIGGDKYALLCSLAYRQVTGSGKLTRDNKNTIRYFLKEISSDGDISTVDVIFPESPMLLFLQPELLWLQMLPVLEYANNMTAAVPYNKTWAPHHLGTWPIANIKPDQQEDMPVEETANMMLMLASLNKVSHDITRLNPFWKLLQQWGVYLNSTSLDPGNQLCTDDFEGPSPHNANLALKGIMGMAAYSVLCKQAGYTKEAEAFMAQAKDYAQKWTKLAADGDHSRLQYDKPNSWSLKYNLLFQQVLDVDVFPKEVIEKELAFYKLKTNKYGVPLDIRADFTKLDWEAWVAALAEEAQFTELISKSFDFANETPDRAPLSDWYYTSNASMAGFHARPVVGGLFARALLTALCENEHHS